MACFFESSAFSSLSAMRFFQVRNGFTSAGRQRWRCKFCGSSQVRFRQSKKVEGLFTRWLLGKLSKEQAASSLGVSVRHFSRIIQPLWDDRVQSPEMSQKPVFVVVDGKRVGQQILLIGSNSETISWRWSEAENSYWWKQFLSTIPEPRYLVCDGQKSYLKP